MLLNAYLLPVKTPESLYQLHESTPLLPGSKVFGILTWMETPVLAGSTISWGLQYPLYVFSIEI
jgi:hypothetical protein